MPENNHSNKIAEGESNWIFENYDPEIMTASRLHVSTNSQSVFIHPTGIDSVRNTVTFGPMPCPQPGYFSSEVAVENVKAEPVRFIVEILTEDGTLLQQSAIEVPGGQRMKFTHPLPDEGLSILIRLSTEMAEGGSAANAWARFFSFRISQPPKLSSAEVRSSFSDYKKSVAMVFVMNHPHPEVIPKLKAIYGSRFSKSIFLVPFYNSPEDNVFAVYRSSYVHNTFICDAASRLKEFNVSHYVICQDDVILSPDVNENNILDVLGLGENDGFIDHAMPIHSIETATEKNWYWILNVLFRLTFPMSSLWGSGVQRQNFLRYLPTPEFAYQKLAQYGIATPEYLIDTEISPESPNYSSFATSIFNIPGVSGGEYEKACMDGIAAILSAANIGSGMDKIPMPYPFAMTGPESDFYIIPKTALDRFSHISGVLGAAGIFAEVATPTSLLLSCDNVKFSKDSGVKTRFWFGGRAKPTVQDVIDFFSDKKNFIEHPVKLSLFDMEQIDNLINLWGVEKAPQGNC